MEDEIDSTDPNRGLSNLKKAITAAKQVAFNEVCHCFLTQPFSRMVLGQPFVQQFDSIDII